MCICVSRKPAGCLGEAGFSGVEEEVGRDRLLLLLFIFPENDRTACPTLPPASSACGEVNSDGLKSKRKAESTIGRRIKIIKTNSNCSQRNQFHNFSVSLNLLPRFCSAEQRA